MLASTDHSYADPVISSLQVSGLAVAVGLPVAVALAWLLTAERVPLRWLLETLINLPLVMPPVVTGYVLLLLFGRRGLVGEWLDATLGIQIAFTRHAAALAAVVVSLPLMVGAVRVALQAVDPRLVSAARTLGASPADVFATVVLPLAWRGVVTAAVLGFARALGEFGATLMLAGNIPGQTQTIPLAIYDAVETPGGMARAQTLVLISAGLAAWAMLIAQCLQRTTPNSAGQTG